MEEDEEEWFSEDLKKSYFLQLASQYKQGSFFLFSQNIRTIWDGDFFKFDYGKKVSKPNYLSKLPYVCYFEGISVYF